MRRVGSAVIALMGLWVLATSPTQLAYASLWIASLFGSDSGVSKAAAAKSAMVSTLPFLVALLVGLVLLMFREQLSDRLFDEAPTSLGEDATVLLGAAIVVLGLYFAVISSVSFVRIASSGLNTAFQTHGDDFSSLVFRERVLSLTPQLLAAAIEFALGLFLVVRSRAVAVWAIRRQQADA